MVFIHSNQTVYLFAIGSPASGRNNTISLTFRRRVARKRLPDSDRNSRLHNFPVTEKRGGCPRFGVGTWVLGWPSLHVLNIHGKQRRLSAKVIRPATPRPIPRMIYQPALYRIGMHVIQLLSLLSPAIHIEIVKSRLPERPQWFTRRRKWQSQLPRARSLPFAQLACHA